MIDISIRCTLIRVKYLETDGIYGNLIASAYDIGKSTRRRA